MHRASFPTTGQSSLPHHAPDSFVVDFPTRTRQRFGHTTIAITNKDFTKFLDGLPQLLVSLLSRQAAMLVIPLAIDLQEATKLSHRAC